jgi:hypothetical protein
VTTAASKLELAHLGIHLHSAHGQEMQAEQAHRWQLCSWQAEEPYGERLRKRGGGRPQGAWMSSLSLATRKLASREEDGGGEGGEDGGEPGIPSSLNKDRQGIFSCVFCGLRWSTPWVGLSKRGWSPAFHRSMGGEVRRSDSFSRCMIR